MSRQILRVAFFLGAGAPRYRLEMVSAASWSMPVLSGAALVAEIPLPERRERHLLDYAVDFPRALELAYEVECGDTRLEGKLGETFAAYRARRLVELERERTEQARLVGSLVGTVVGRAEAKTPVGTAKATVAVDSAAIVATAVPLSELPPGDLGARRIARRLEIRPGSAGTCRLTLRPASLMDDASGVRADLTLTREVDLVAERVARVAVAEQDAQRMRAAMVLDLVRIGADPSARERHSREEAERLRVALELAVALRTRIVASLTGMGADPTRRAKEEERRSRGVERQNSAIDTGHAAVRPRPTHLVSLDGTAAEPAYRAKLAADAEYRDAELRRAAAEQSRLQLAAALELRMRLTSGLIAAGADPGYRAQRQFEELRIGKAALELRTQLIAVLIARGADPAYRDKRDLADLLAYESEQRWRATARPTTRTATTSTASSEVAIDLRIPEPPRVVIRVTPEPPPAPLPSSAMPVRPTEHIPAPPSHGAVWIQGQFAWNGAAWVWIAGRWAPASPPAARPRVEVHDRRTR